MHDIQKMEQEKSVLRWGGLAGILGSILFILTWVVIFMGPVGGEDPADLAGWVTRFPDIQIARVLENSIYLVAVVFEVMLFLALYRALRKTSLAPALFGSVLAILGLTVFMVGSFPHAAHARLFDLYSTPGVTPESQETLAILWQAVWGINDSVLYVGFFVLPIGILLLGIAMLGSSDFGKGLGWVSVVLGLVGFFAAVMQIIDPASMIGAATFFACLIFYFVAGLKVFRLSQAS